MILPWGLWLKYKSPDDKSGITNYLTLRGLFGYHKAGYRLRLITEKQYQLERARKGAQHQERV